MPIPFLQFGDSSVSAFMDVDYPAFIDGYFPAVDDIPAVIDGYFPLLIIVLSVGTLKLLEMFS